MEAPGALTVLSESAKEHVFEMKLFELVGANRFLKTHDENVDIDGYGLANLNFALQKG